MANTMRLAAVRVFVSDVAGACAFYRDQIGLVPSVEAVEDGFVVFRLANGADLVLEEGVPEDETAESLVGRFVGASLAVDDIDAAYDALCDQGVRFIDPPERQPWGGTLAHFLDPDDNILTLVELPKGEADA
jgi:predicted enzyme related to lactoylglutathione lyase